MCNQACAIGKTHFEAVEASFQTAASSATCEDRLTALMRAALIGYTGAITDFLACGIDVNATDQHGWTALKVTPRADTEIIRMLKRAGAKNILNI